MKRQKKTLRQSLGATEQKGSQKTWEKFMRQEWVCIREKTCSSNGLKQLTTKVTTNSVLAYKHKTFSGRPNGIVSRFDFFKRIFIALSLPLPFETWRSSLLVCPKGRVSSGIRVCVVGIFWILIFASHINNASFIGYKDNLIRLSFISCIRRKSIEKTALSTVFRWHARF